MNTPLFNKEKYYNAQYIGQLSPYDISDNNPLLLFETFEGRKLRIKLKALYILEFDLPKEIKEFIEKYTLDISRLNDEIKELEQQTDR